MSRSFKIRFEEACSSFLSNARVLFDNEKKAVSDPEKNAENKMRIGNNMRVTIISLVSGSNFGFGAPLLNQLKYTMAFFKVEIIKFLIISWMSQLKIKMIHTRL